MDPKSYGTFSGGPKAAAVVALDIRNGEPVALDVEDLWLATATESGAPFPMCDLSQDWCDYDEKSAQSVGIVCFVVEFERRTK